MVRGQFVYYTLVYVHLSVTFKEAVFPSRATLPAWSLAAREEALREVNDRRQIYLGSSGSPFSCYYSRSLVP